MPAWAAAAAAVVGAGATIYASNNASDAANNAAQMQQASANQSINAQQTALDKQIALNQPWQDAGLKALSNYANNPAFSFNASDLTADPSYQFRLQQGVDAMDNSASARGNLLSGGQAKALQNYGQQAASQEYGNAYNRALQSYNTNQNTQLNVANLGRGAAGQTQNALVNNANNVSSTYMQNGNNQAQQQSNMANAYTNGATGVATSLNQGIGNALYAYNSGGNTGGNALGGLSMTSTPMSGYNNYVGTSSPYTGTGTASNLNPSFDYTSMTPLP